jgi:hypothetical protein
MSLDARTTGKLLSDVDIGKILRLTKALMPQQEIADLIKCSKSAVQYTLVTYLFETFQECNPWRKYQRKTTQCEDWYIERALKQNDTLPLCDITNIIQLPISERTVRRRWSEAGLESYVAAEKPGLWKENVIKRLEWAMRYKDWTVDD